MSMAYDKTQQKRIDNGECKDCGAKRGDDGTTVFCRSCANRSSVNASNRNKRLRLERKGNKNACYLCGKEKADDNFSTCEECREKSKIYRKNNADRIKLIKFESGSCKACSKPAMKNRCKSCWTQDILRKHKIAPSLWETFWNMLENQDFKCFYTGIEITPEVNASLDHVVPKVKGGTNDLDNLVWCDRKINSFKNDNDYTSLINICQLILDKHNKRNKSEIPL